MPSPAASLNTLIYKEILTLILQGFKHFSTLSSLNWHIPATHSVIEGFVEGFYNESTTENMIVT
jgi:hypothetical protein